MNDILYLSVVLLFFVCSFGLLAVCQRLLEK
jgi:hypothetical protein